MAELKEVLAAVVPTERGIYTAKDKPKIYCTFLQVLKKGNYANDERQEDITTYRVTLYSKGNYEETLQKILAALEAAGYYINDVGGESYETDTGYWLIPINIQYVKE